MSRPQEPQVRALTRPLLQPLIPSVSAPLKCRAKVDVSSTGPDVLGVANRVTKSHFVNGRGRRAMDDIARFFIGGRAELFVARLKRVHDERFFRLACEVR